MNSRREQSVYVVTFRSTVTGIEGIRALRATLKLALRRFGLKCVDAREVQASPDVPVRTPAILRDGR